MGTKERTLFSSTRNALLSLIYGHADESFYSLQLIRAVGAGRGAVQRELQHLTEMGLVVRKAQGNQVLYQANMQSPIFPEIKSLIAKTVGLHDTLRTALAGPASGIQIAFVFGSLARHADRSGSDVDLLILGDASFRHVVSALAPAQKALRREINPLVFPLAEFHSKLAAGNHFLRGVMKEKKLFVIGSEHELKRLASK
ncbi:MAG TPA: nucleotidyltransferase domain-containing protein [Terriglobales bacterium]|nr:nucleotidyltransferase domain-containing protein [Terriglobales bacterium]